MVGGAWCSVPGFFGSRWFSSQLDGWRCLVLGAWFFWFTVGQFTVGWLAVLGAWCLVFWFTVGQFTVGWLVVLGAWFFWFTVCRFTDDSCSVYCYCCFARALSFRAESRNRQALIIASFSTPLELTDLAWIG